MKIEFETNNIDKKVYRIAIQRYIFILGGMNLFVKMRDWVVTLRPSYLSASDVFFEGVEGVGGYTSAVSKSVIVYVRDVDDDFTGSFYPNIRSNMITISIEVSHAVLIEMGLNHRVPLRHNDLGGNKAGTMLPFFVAEVHDRHIEKKLITFALPIFSWRKFKTNKLYITGIDIKDLI